MKRIVLFSIPLFFFCDSFAQKNKNTLYPSYDIVVNKFFNTYSSLDIKEDDQIKFEKKPDGWHVSTIDGYTYKTNRDELFWSKENKGFQKINFETTSKNNPKKDHEVNRDKRNSVLNIWDKRNYSFSPYYGYSGWDWDVIQDFQNQTNLPDSTLYALGRAYSSYAGNLLNANSGFVLSKDRFVLPDGQNCLSPDQLALYRKYEHLAIDSYKKVEAMNPNFETVVGSIGTKVANEYLTTFLDIRVYQNEEEAKKELTPGLYNDFTLSFSKNMLNSCSKNAILFTFGDGDTFPLLYLQSQYGIRTDVLVVNLSLLQTSRYINSLRNKILDAEPLPISFSPEEINGDKKEVILIDSKGEINKPIELSKMIAFISDDHNTIEYPGKNYSYINTNNFQLTTANTTINLQTDAKYFQRNDLILYDVLANTKLERAIYFAATSSGDSFLKMNNFLQLEGLTYKLTDKVQKKYDNLEFAEINTSLLYKNLMTNFDWKGLDAITSNERTICWAYRSCFQLLFNKLLEEEKPDYAELVLDKYMEEMPNNVMHFDLYTIAVIEGYYKLNKIKKGNEIAKILIYNIDHNIDNYEGLTYSHNSKDWKKTTSEYLKTILETYKQTDLLKELH